MAPVPELPPDLAQALERHEPAGVAFEALSPERQAEWVRFVERARTRRGRARRVHDAVRRLGGWTPVLAQAATEETAEQRPAPAAPPPEREWWPWLALLALLVVGGLLALYFLTRNDNERVAVPRVVGLQERVALERLSGRGLLARVSHRPSDRPRGVVFGQDPQPGTKLDEGDRVQIAVSNAPARLLAPDVVGLSVAEAERTLVAAGLVPDERRVFAEKKRGTVVEQVPKAGTRVQKGDSVVVTVSKGRGRTSVPDVVGQTREDAETALEGAGLVPRAVTVGSSQPEGTVTAQNPAAGEQVTRGATVRINVSSGPAAGTTTAATTTAATTTTSRSSTVPSLSGLGQTAAIRRLLAAGLKPRVVYVASDETENSVTRQSPTAGTAVRRGSRVRISLSAGPSPSFVNVPDVVGQTASQARQTLEEAGFTVVVFRVSGQPGVVVEQQPPAGGNAPDGGQVSIFVGR